MAQDRKRQRRREGHRTERRISVRSVRREVPDLRKLARALIALAQAEAEAQAQHESRIDESGVNPRRRREQ